MAKIKKLNQNGEILYPVTHEDAIFDANGVSVGEKLQNLKDNMIEFIDITEIEEIENDIVGRVEDIEEKVNDFLVETSIDILRYSDLVVNNDWSNAFEQATVDCNYHGYDLYIPKGEYQISRTWYIPQNVTIYGTGQGSRIVANQSFCDNENESAVVSLDNSGQAIYKLTNVYIGAVNQNNNLNGLHIGGCRASEFSHLVIQGLGKSGVLIYPTVEDSGDIENFTLNHVWTNKVYEGLTIKSNPNINRGNITDGQVIHCQFTTLDNEYTKDSGHAINVSGSNGKYIFNVFFNRCFTHTRNNSLINIESIETQTVYDLHFTHIKGELWGNNGLSDDVSNVYAMTLNFIKNCSFDSCFIFENNSKGVMLTNCKYNDFRNFYWDYPVNPTAKYFYLDAECAFNSIQINIENAYFESSNQFANCHLDMFKDKIIDLGYSNHVYNSTFKNEVKIINDVDKLFNVVNGQLSDYPLSQGYSVELVNGRLKLTLKANVNDARIIMPINIPSKQVGMYLKYTLVNISNVDIEAGVSGLSKPLRTVGDHECLVVFDNTIHNYGYYYIRVKSGKQLNSDVVLYIDKFEIYEGFNLPYLPNYILFK